MIKIIGDKGEGAGKIVNLAIEKLRESEPESICFLLDDTGEFYPLTEKYQGVTINVSAAYKPFQENVLSKIDRSNFFRFLFEVNGNCSHEAIEEYAKELQGILGRKVYVLYKTVTEI